MSDQFIFIIFEDRWRVLSLVRERDYDNPPASYCLRTHSLPSCRPQKAVIQPFKSGTVIKMFYLYLVQGYTSVKRTLNISLYTTKGQKYRMLYPLQSPLLIVDRPSKESFLIFSIINQNTTKFKQTNKQKKNNNNHESQQINNTKIKTNSRQNLSCFSACHLVFIIH